jgi:flagellar protein FliJ
MVMTSRDSTVRAKRFEISEQARKVAQLEATMRDFEIMAGELSRQITNEEDRTGVRDQGHFAYSTFAKAAAQRRSNLLTSVAELKVKLAAAKREHDEAVLALTRLEPATEDRGRLRRKGDPRAVAGG